MDCVRAGQNAALSLTPVQAQAMGTVFGGLEDTLPPAGSGGGRDLSYCDVALGAKDSRQRGSGGSPRRGREVGGAVLPDRGSSDRFAPHRDGVTPEGIVDGPPGPAIAHSCPSRVHIVAQRTAKSATASVRAPRVDGGGGGSEGASILTLATHETLHAPYMAASAAGSGIDDGGVDNLFAGLGLLDNDEDDGFANHCGGGDEGEAEDDFGGVLGLMDDVPPSRGRSDGKTGGKHPSSGSAKPMKSRSPLLAPQDDYFPTIKSGYQSRPDLPMNLSPINTSAPLNSGPGRRLSPDMHADVDVDVEEEEEEDDWYRDCQMATSPPSPGYLLSSSPFGGGGGGGGGSSSSTRKGAVLLDASLVSSSSNAGPEAASLGGGGGGGASPPLLRAGPSTSSLSSTSSFSSSGAVFEFEAVVVLLGGRWPARGLISGRWPPVHHHPSNSQGGGTARSCPDPGPIARLTVPPHAAAPTTAGVGPHSGQIRASTPAQGSVCCSVEGGFARLSGGNLPAASGGRMMVGRGGCRSALAASSPFAASASSPSGVGGHMVVVHCGSVRQAASVLWMQELERGGGVGAAGVMRAGEGEEEEEDAGRYLGMRATAAILHSGFDRTSLGSGSGRRVSVPVPGVAGASISAAASGGDVWSSGEDGGATDPDLDPDYDGGEEEGSSGFLGSSSDGLGGGAFSAGSRSRSRSRGVRGGPSCQLSGCIVRVRFRFLQRPEWLRQGARLILRDRSDGHIAGAGYIGPIGAAAAAVG